MKYSYDYRADARRILQNHWGLAVGATFVAGILGGQLGISGGGGSSNGKAANSAGSASSVPTDTTFSDLPVFSPVLSLFGGLAAAFLAMVAAVVVVSLIIRIVIGGASTMGLVRFNLNLYRTGSAQLSDIFSCFCYFGKAFVMNLLRGLYIFLWSLCLIIPGIMASYSYVMTPFLLTDHPEMSADEAIGASKALMYGHRWDYFCMEFSFIGWDLLCLLTLGIGNLVLEPYKNAARTSFYSDLISAQQPPCPQEPAY